VDKQIRAERKERHFAEASFLLVTIRPPLHHLRPHPSLRDLEAVWTKAERNLTWFSRTACGEPIAATETRRHIQSNDNMHQAHLNHTTPYTMVVPGKLTRTKRLTRFVSMATPSATMTRCTQELPRESLGWTEAAGVVRGRRPSSSAFFIAPQDGALPGDTKHTKHNNQDAGKVQGVQDVREVRNVSWHSAAIVGQTSCQVGTDARVV
jgi:hypothetical protein